MSKPNRKATVATAIAGTAGQLMVMAAHRYCLGRQSYIVSACIEWLHVWWAHIEPNTRNVIIRDTIEALQDGTAGAECDSAGWRAFAEQAWAQMDVKDRAWCYQAVAHRHQPWPLNTPKDT